MSGVKERIKFILNHEGLKQKDIADQLSTTPQTINNWMKRNAISRDGARQLSEKYGYSLDWILNGIGPPKLINKGDAELSTLSIREKYPQKADGCDEVAVPFLKGIELACGDGGCQYDDYSQQKLQLPRWLLRRSGANSDGSGVLCFPVRGNSMEPLIPDGSVVAVNTLDKNIVDGKIYAINQDGWKRLKILYRTGTNRLSVRSFNSAEHATEDRSMDEIEIIGRMFWSSVVW